jgi:hypothetical protein
MATYCRSTVFLLARERIGLVATSVLLEPARAGGEPFAALADVAPILLPDELAAIISLLNLG